MLYLIGLGLSDIKDISVRGLEIARSCDEIYLESYTSILFHSTVKEIELFIGKPLKVADRDLVEQGVEEILDSAVDRDVALLVVGDPLSATTHTDLLIRASGFRRNNGDYTSVKTRVVHNASIMTAVAATGLQLYNFGPTVSIPLWEEQSCSTFTVTQRPESFFDRLDKAHAAGWHTLCLLDIKVKERSVENLIRGRDIFEPPRYMTARQAAQQIVAVIRERKQRLAVIKSNSNHSCVEDEEDMLSGDYVAQTTNLTEQSRCVAVARVGSPTQQMIATTLDALADDDSSDARLGPPLHSLVIVAPQLHEMEASFFSMMMNNQ